MKPRSLPTSARLTSRIAEVAAGGDSPLQRKDVVARMSWVLKGTVPFMRGGAR